MTEQSEAQRLAECLERDCEMNWPDYDNQMAAAAELRRLEAEIERKAAGIKFLWQECDNQERITAQLYRALLEYKRLYEEVQPAGGWQGVYETGNAAIKAAKGEA